MPPCSVRGRGAIDAPESDIDIMIQFDPEARVTVFDYAGLKEYIAGLFDGPVDVVDRGRAEALRSPRRHDRRHLCLLTPRSAALRDIAHHIDLAAQFAAGFEYDTFRADPRTVYAVTRCLEIISEASRRLPDELKARHPAIAWRDTGGGGQRLIATTMRTLRPSRFGTLCNSPCPHCSKSLGAR